MCYKASKKSWKIWIPILAIKAGYRSKEKARKKKNKPKGGLGFEQPDLQFGTSTKCPKSLVPIGGQEAG